MNKRLFSIAAAIAVALVWLAPVPVKADGGFADVDADAWYADAVSWAARSEITNGVSETRFSPDGLCTRAQMVTFLWRANGRPSPEKTKGAFSDVPAGCYYEQAALWAAEAGIVSASASFLPEAECSCGELLTLLWRSEGRPSPEAPSEITSNWPESEEKSSVAWAESKGMLDGSDIPPEKFDPAMGCTRGWAIRCCYDVSFRFVTTVSQLVYELRPCRTVCLAPGEYNLTEWITLADAGARCANPYVRVEEVFDGEALTVVGLDHVTLCSPTGDPSDVRIVTEPRYANVLSFLSCSDITLRDMTMGHTPEQGYCLGGVVYAEDCGSVFLNNLDLYGCGTYGISAFDTETVRADGVVIHDCSYGGVELYRVGRAEFTGCTVKNCREFDILTVVDSEAEFTRCTFEDNRWGKYFNFLHFSGSRIIFDRCSFDRASYQALLAQKGEAVAVSGETVK
ncbi:MAG: S-layer homology domain-containing protein [Oscillospiraceae bacterium]|nr:S-layer homology domain-containing protein [Oscillospiraceae bacterium]